VRKNIFAILFLAICPVLFAQQSLNNDSVIKLVKAGLSDELIVSTINASAGTYNTSADGIIALKTAGVSDKVVAAIVTKASAPAPSAVAPAPAATDPDDPAAPHDSGIYIYSGSAPVGSKMVMLRPSSYTPKIASGGVLSGMTYGLTKVKNKDVVRGAHASVRINDSQPNFYFYFEDAEAIWNNHASTTLGPSLGSARVPIEFVLLKFDIKGDTREVVKFSANAFGSSGNGTEDKAVTGFTYTKLRPGVYKVTLKAPLSLGEYGFISVSGASGYSVFDFGKD
jgi:hypothetical protein